MPIYYPPGVTGNEPQLAGYPETTQSADCSSCGIHFDELTFVWSYGEGVADCPECGEEVWIEKPDWESPDWEFPEEPIGWADKW